MELLVAVPTWGAEVEWRFSTRSSGRNIPVKTIMSIWQMMAGLLNDYYVEMYSYWTSKLPRSIYCSEKLLRTSGGLCKGELYNLALGFFNIAKLCTSYKETRGGALDPGRFTFYITIL